VYELTYDFRVLKDGVQVAQFGITINCVAERKGNLYVGTEGLHAWELTPEGGVRQIAYNSPPASGFQGCAIGNDGVMWCVGNDFSTGLWRFADGAWGSIVMGAAAPPGFGCTGATMPTAINEVMATTTGDLWVGTFGYGFKRHDASTGAWYHYMDTSSTDQLAGCWQFACPIVRIGESPDSAWWTFGSAICEDSLGNVWLGNERAWTGTILHVYDPARERWRSFTRDGSGFAGLYIRSLEASYDPRAGYHRVYVGITEAEERGKFGLSIVGYRDPFSTAVSLSHVSVTTSIHDIAVASDSLVWVASGAGLHRLRDNDVQQFKRMDRVRPGHALYTVALSPHGHPVFSMDGDLYEYQDTVGDFDSLINLTRSGMLGKEVYDILYDRRGACYWISTIKGLFRFRTGEYLDPPVTDYGQIVVYPNPLSISRGERAVTFDKLVPGSRVVLYDIAGTLLWQSRSQDVHGPSEQAVTWNGVNRQGRAVLPGTYFYHVFAGGEKRRVGKLLVIP
jgi:ligand-binding sensor domain-containing protein